MCDSVHYTIMSVFNANLIFIHVPGKHRFLQNLFCAADILCQMYANKYVMHFNNRRFSKLLEKETTVNSHTVVTVEMEGGNKKTTVKITEINVSRRSNVMLHLAVC